MRILIFGKVPPPIGGVTKSVENLLASLDKKHIEYKMFSFKDIFISKRFDIAHIHYSNDRKRFFAILLAKFLSKKVIFTLHGAAYKQCLINTISKNFSDGVIFLNKNTLEKFNKGFSSSIILTSIFKEGLCSKKEISSKKLLLFKNPEKIYLLLYAQKKHDKKGDVYGVDFIFNNIEILDNKYVVVLLDPRGHYKELNLKYKDKFVHIDEFVDFEELLLEVDIYIRPTSMDGNSVAVIEALLLNKPVLASDVVTRPYGVELYHFGSFDDFQFRLKSLNEGYNTFEPDSINKYLDYCNSLLGINNES